VADQGDDHVDAQDEKGHSNQAAHELVQPLWKAVPRHDGQDPQGQHHQRVPQDVEGAEQERLPPVLLGAGDVGDGRDVVPVDAVAEPEGERGQEEPELEAALQLARHHGRLSLAACCI
jgi:hypothetical protein